HRFEKPVVEGTDFDGVVRPVAFAGRIAKAGHADNHSGRSRGLFRRAVATGHRLLRLARLPGGIIQLVLPCIADEAQTNGQYHEDTKHNAGGPGEDVSGLGPESGTSAAASAERAAQSASAALLDQHQQGQDKRDEQQQRKQCPEGKGDHEASPARKRSTKYYKAALTIARKLSGLSEAPPMSPPSTSGC